MLVSRLKSLRDVRESETKYQTLTPVPPIPPVSAIAGNYGGTAHHPGGHGIYGHHPMSFPAGLPPGYHPSFMQHPSSGQTSRHPIGFLSNHGDGASKQLKLGGIAEPDSSTPETQVTVENSFQVPSVSSTTARPVNGGQSGLGPAPPGVPHLSMYHPEHYPPPPPPGPPIGPVPSSPHLPQLQQQQQQQTQQPPPPPPPPQQQQQQPQQVVPRPDSWEHSKAMIGPSSIPGQTMVQAGNSGDNVPQTEKVTKKKRKRCGECPGCLKKDNCGECGPCKSVRSHQICKMRKCDQLKTKKEKVREAAQAAAAQAAAAAAVAVSGGLPPLSGSKEISSGSGVGLSSGEPGAGPGSRPPPVALNGSNGRVFVGDPPSSGGAGPRTYQEYGSTKTESHVNHYTDVGPPTASFTNYHSHHMSGSYNGHILSPGDVRTPVSAMEEGSSPSDPTNRHQMMNHRLKSLIQSRQSSKGLSNSNGQSAPGYTSPGGTSNFSGSNYGVTQQTVTNSSMSPHYINSTGMPVQSDVGFGQLNWDSADSENAQNNGESGPASNENKQERRVPFSSVDAHNGLSFNNSYSHFERNTPSNPTYSATEGGQQPSNTNGNPVQYLSSFSTSTTATNQSQQQYSPLAQSPSLPQRPQSHTSAQEVPSFQTQSQSSATSPARSKSVESNTGGGDAANNGLGSNPSTNSSVNNNEESTDQQTQPFLSSTTTSMNTYTNIISTFNAGSSNAYSSSMPSSPTYLLPPPPPPHFGFYTTGNQTVIMTSVPGTGFEASKTFSPMAAGVGHYMGIDCGRSLDQLDSSSSSPFGLLDLNSYGNTSKSDPSSSSASSFLASESQVSSIPSTNVLPPVSLLLPSFREHGWWERMKSTTYGSSLTGVGNKMDHSEPNCEAMDCNSDERMESEYSSRSSSTLTTLPASISN